MIASGVAPAVDIQTLYLAAAIVTAFFGVAFLAFHFIDASTRGILQWGLGYFLIAGGLISAVFRGLLPLFVYGPVTNSRRARTFWTSDCRRSPSCCCSCSPT
ncbi:MAG: hypothetical protein ACOCYX_02470 [Spirochaetota bacterium]